MQVARQVWHSVCVVAGVICAHDSLSQEGLLPIIDAREYAGVTVFPELRDGVIVFSRYAGDGSNEEIVAVDPFDGSAEAFASRGRRPRYITADDRYLVYTTAGSLMGTVVLADRNTGQVLASVSLRDVILWAHIRGDRLTLIQGRYRAPSPVLIYRLPDLKLERSFEIAAVTEMQSWGEGIVAIGKQLSVYDRNLALIGVLDFPPAYPDLNSYCPPHGLRIHGDLGMLNSGCFQIALYDLPALEHRRTIRGFANGHGLAAVDGQLFASGDLAGEPHLRVYEIETGRETAQLRLNGYIYAARDHRLLVMQTEGSASAYRATVHVPDIDAIHSASD
jgi:hypothetical protein